MKHLAIFVSVLVSAVGCGGTDTTEPARVASSPNAQQGNPPTSLQRQIQAPIIALSSRAAVWDQMVALTQELADGLERMPDASGASPLFDQFEKRMQPVLAAARKLPAKQDSNAELDKQKQKAFDLARNQLVFNIRRLGIRREKRIDIAQDVLKTLYGVK